MAHLEDGQKDKQFLCSNTKKNIFLIGDSIRLGYCATTREKLSDIADVFYVSDNCRNTQYVITRLYTWANMFSDRSLVDVVQFNCGHWDMAHWYGGELPLTSETEYARNIQIIIKMMEKLFPNAKIVFATTTKMNPNGTIGLNPRTTEDIMRYNEIAKEVALRNNVMINDLFAVTRDWDEFYYKDYCHFTIEAGRLLGEAVATTLKTIF